MKYIYETATGSMLYAKWLVLYIDLLSIVMLMVCLPTYFKVYYKVVKWNLTTLFDRNYNDNDSANIFFEPIEYSKACAGISCLFYLLHLDRRKA